MEIILRKSDIELLIRKNYSSIKEIKFSGKNPRVVLVMDDNVTTVLPSKQIEPKSVTEHNIKAETIETPKKETPPGNVMGKERQMVSF
jgi:hypothetical protein